MHRIQITASGTYNITENMGSDILLYSSRQISLDNDLTIAYSGTPEQGQKLKLYCSLSLGTTSGVREVTVLGNEFQHIQFAEYNSFVIEAVYNESAWRIFAMPSIIPNTARQNLQDVETILVTTGTVEEFISRKNRQRIELRGTTTITSTFEVRYDEIVSPVNGQFYEIAYNAYVTYGNQGSFVTIFGRNLTQQEALSGDLYITALYTTDSGWIVRVSSPATATQLVDFSLIVTDAQVKALNTTPLNVIVGQTGKLIIPVDIYIKKVGTSAYATNTKLQLYYDGVTKGVYSYDNNYILSNTTNGAIQKLDKVGASSSVPYISGATLKVMTADGNATEGGTGNGLVIFGTYKLVTA